MSKGLYPRNTKRFWIVCYVVSFLITFGILAYQSLKSTFLTPDLKTDFGFALFLSPFTCFVGAYVYEMVNDPIRWVIRRLKSLKSDS